MAIVQPKRLVFRPRTPVRLVVAEKTAIHLDARPLRERLLVQAGRAGSKDVPQPQVRAAFGFTI